MADELVMAMLTIDTLDQARRMATALVEQKLAGCVNILPGVESVYRWEDELQNSSECLLLAKTAPAKITALVDMVKSIHPYQLPEIIVLPVTGGNRDYIDWVRREISPHTESE